MANDAELRHEAQVLTRYLVGARADEEAMRHYAAACLFRAGDLGSTTGLWRLLMRRPFLLPAADAALALQQPYHPVRKRILVMIAVLESLPQYEPYFLERKRTLLYPVLLGARLFFYLPMLAIGALLIWKKPRTSS
jgi:hypothetical protein